MPEKETAFFASASLGFRGWRLDGGLLRPSHKSAGEPWSPGVTIASCASATMRDPHKAPDAECRCGLHAYHDATRLEPAIALQRLMEREGDRGFCEIVGAVAARGDLRVHHEGWRAEEAQILGLMVIDVDTAPQWRLTATANAGEHYGVPVFATMEELVAHATSLADPIPLECRPPAPPEPSAEEQAEKIIEIRRRVAADRERAEAGQARAQGIRERARHLGDHPINADLEPS